MDRHTLPNRQELVTRAQTPQSLLRELFSARSRFRCQSPSHGSPSRSLSVVGHGPVWCNRAHDPTTCLTQQLL
jgi:hypothetical protein